jgi:two-component system CheB/CheR fusion protein
VAARDQSRAGNELKNFQNRFVRKDGTSVIIYWTAKWDANDKIMYCVARDGTSRKEFEDTIKASEEKYKILFYKNPQPMWIYNIETLGFIEVNEATIEQYGYSREEFLLMTIKDIRPVEEIPKLLSARSNPDHKSLNKSVWKHQKKNGEIIHVEITAYPLELEGQKSKLVLAYNVTEQLEAEDKLIRSNERYIYASKAAFDAIWDWDLKQDEVYWSGGYETLFGHKLEDNKEYNGIWSNHIHPMDKERVMNRLNEAIENGGTNFEAEYRFRKADGNYAYVIDRGIIIRNESKEAYRMIGAMQDYTEKEKNEQALKELNASLERRASELASSNKELERFAYVASHDLQEPLRMVSSFLQLLQKRYKDKLDDKANEYIHFAVDGAERMKVLILDLLKYSRVNTVKEEHELLDLNELFSNILFTYKQIVEETKTIIQTDRLPIVVGTKTQLVQLFQNLIGNALKYRSDRTPVITVGFTEQPEFWQFFVKDNGIGIEPRFYEKIFVIFQRLHHKDEYSGTGIGLAICKKIVERHRGNIWIESTVGEGSTFYFTLKKDLKVSQQVPNDNPF